LFVLVSNIVVCVGYGGNRTRRNEPTCVSEDNLSLATRIWPFGGQQKPKIQTKLHHISHFFGFSLSSFVSLLASEQKTKMKTRGTTRHTSQRGRGAEAKNERQKKRTASKRKDEEEKHEQVVEIESDDRNTGTPGESDGEMEQSLDEEDENNTSNSDEGEGEDKDKEDADEDEDEDEDENTNDNAPEDQDKENENEGRKAPEGGMPMEKELPPVTDWESLGLDSRLVAAAKRQGWTEPSPVQAAAIPLALAGRDLLVRARTGSGKTAAYSLPLIHHALLAKEVHPMEP